MLEGLNFLIYAGYSGGFFGRLISSWESAGVFVYVLPFLLIFVLVFGILSKLSIFNENKGVNAIIALVVGFMALQFNVVSTFFNELFPRLGIGLSIILALLIITGLFINPKNKGWMIGLSIISLIIVAIVVYTSFNNWPWTYSVWFQNNWANVLGILVFIGLIVAVIVFSNTRDKNGNFESDAILAKALSGLLGGNQKS